MCGIAGLLRMDGSPAESDILYGMIRTLCHRGPEANNVVTEPGVGLAHARLSIIDLATGTQPMSAADGQVWISFNGEIFNYLELRADLIRRGHRFGTRSDTEVILHSYLEKGEECVHDFNGQWAFAIWDRRTKKLFLSRDRMGVRPLFYSTVAHDFIFASEIKALFAYPGVERVLDTQGLDQILTFWSTLPERTAFKGIRQLPPGHSLALQRGKISVCQYWKPEFHIEGPEPSDVLCKAEELLALLDDAARLRLRSDVPVGTYLSGGIDSTLITALVARNASNRLRSFSVTFGDASFDESAYQDEASRCLRTQHEKVHCTADDIARIFPDVIRHTEQPIVRTAPAPMYLLAKLVHDCGFKVVLTGEGSDELLGGYDIFKEAKVRRFCAQNPKSSRRPLLLRRLYPYLDAVQKQPEAYLRAFFHVREDDLSSPFFSHLLRWEMTSKIKLFYSGRLKSDLADRDCLVEMLNLLPAEFHSWPNFCQAQYLETVQLLAGYILSSQGDRMAMAHSVEGRYPFLDHRLVEFAGKLHPTLKMKVLQEKYLLKVACKGMVPDSIIRRPKQPYRAPGGSSFFGPNAAEYVMELLSPDALQKYDLFETQPVARLVAKFRSGRQVTTRDDMALAAILSTQLLAHEFKTQG